MSHSKIVIRNIQHRFGLRFATVVYGAMCAETSVARFPCSSIRLSPDRWAVTVLAVRFQIRQDAPYWKEGHVVNGAGRLSAVSCQQPVWRYVRGVSKQIIPVGNKFDLSRPFAFSPLLNLTDWHLLHPVVPTAWSQIRRWSNYWYLTGLYNCFRQ